MAGPVCCVKRDPKTAEVHETIFYIFVIMFYCVLLLLFYGSSGCCWGLWRRWLVYSAGRSMPVSQLQQRLSVPKILS